MIHNRVFSLIAAGFIAAAASTAMAADPAPSTPDSKSPFTVSGNFSGTSNYLLRGISLTRNNPAAQGLVEVSHESGFYFNTFASNISFLPKGSLEVDPRVGYRTTFGKLGVDFNLTYFPFPGALAKPLHPSYEEFGLNLTYDLDPVTLVGSVYYSPDYLYQSGQEKYVEGGLDYKLPVWDLTAGGRVGYEMVQNNVRFGYRDYTNYNLALSREFYGFTTAVSFSTTDLDKAHCNGTTLCGDKYMLTLTKKF